MEKKKAFLMGPFSGEFYWEAARFAPMLPYYRNTYKNSDVTFIINTRPERFDLYGKYADILVPLYIKNDYVNYSPNCFRLDNFPFEEYDRLINVFKDTYKNRFHIIDHLYPNIRGKAYVNKNQYPQSKMVYRYAPRSSNYDVINENIQTDKPIVLLSSRYRNNNADASAIKKRNWPHWQDLYNLISDSVYLMDNFTFVLVGKNGEYVPDLYKRFYDINNFSVDLIRNSISGLLLVLLERACLTCGSQSAIPNLSLLFGVDVLEWGHQKELHTRHYNPKKTPILFLDDMNYTLDPKIVVSNLVSLLLKKEKKNGYNKQMVKGK